VTRAHRSLLRAVSVLVLTAVAGLVGIQHSSTAQVPSVSGRVTAADGTPLAGICVFASLPHGGAGNVTATDGTYSLPNVGSQSVTVRFTAGSLCERNGVNGANYASQYYKGVYRSSSATPIQTSPTQTVTGVDAVMIPGGTITGTVSVAASPSTHPQLCVVAQSLDGSWSADQSTGADGTYTIDGLPTAAYHVEFFGPLTPGVCTNRPSYIPQWYNDEPTAVAADPIIVIAGHVTGNVNAALVPMGTTPSTTTARATPSSVMFGHAVSLSATVTGGALKPTGRVGFAIGSVPLCTATVSAGSGSCRANVALPGLQTVTATYSGDATYASSTGTTMITVSAPPPPPSPPPPPVVLPSGPPPSGYDLVGSDGGVFVFPTGQPAGFYGSLPGLGIRVSDVVGMVPSPDDGGYFLVGTDGGVFAFGDAAFEGSLPGLGVIVHDIRGIVPTSDDRGYFLVGTDGGVFAFGDARYLGSLPGEGVKVSDVVGIAATSSDHGYWVVEANGTVHAFGDAADLGSVQQTQSPVAGIAPTTDGGGYWIATQDGAVFPFGDATGHGSLPALGISPSGPVIGVVPTSDDAGYWLAGSDGGVFAFGDAPFVGSLPGLGIHIADVVGAVPTRL
jgi:hypothetical protein